MPFPHRISRKQGSALLLLILTCGLLTTAAAQTTDRAVLGELFSMDN